jgi:type IV pilus assembly protein PilN
MTIDINLLPWREAQREKRNRRFIVGLSLAALLGAAGGGGAALFHQQALSDQQQRNHHIQTRMQRLDQDIAAIRDYRTLREGMLTQITLIQQLQFSRPHTVRVFDQLAATLQPGIRYTRFSRHDGRLHLRGQADNNRRVSAQMRAMAASEVFGIPLLSEVQNAGDGESRRFQMSVEETLPAAPGVVRHSGDAP